MTDEKRLFTVLPIRINLPIRKQVLAPWPDEAVHVVRGEVGREHGGAEVVAGVCLVADIQ